MACTILLRFPSEPVVAVGLDVRPDAATVWADPHLAGASRDPMFFGPLIGLLQKLSDRMTPYGTLRRQILEKNEPD